MGDRNAPLLDETADDAERVVQAALALLEHDVAAAHAEHADRLAGVAHAGDPDDVRLGLCRLLDEVSVAELVLAERVDVGDGLAAEALGQEADLVALDVLDDEDLELGEEVQRDLVHGVAQDALLHEQHVAPPLFDLLAQLENVRALLLDDAVHLAVVVHYDGVVHVRLGRGQLELDERDLGLLHAPRAAAGGDDVLVEHDAVDELGVLDGAADLLDDADVTQVDVCRRRRQQARHRVHRDGREEGRELRHDLRPV